MTTSIRIRRAQASDAEALCEMAVGLLVHLGDDPAAFVPERFIDDAFGADPQFTVFLAEVDGRPVGYALFVDSYEPAFCARGVYLCDIFVRAEMRRHGIGRALLAALARDTQERGRTFLWWVARGDDAREFYRTLANVEQTVSAHAVTFDAFATLATIGARP